MGLVSFVQRLPSGRYRVRLVIPKRLRALMGERTILTRSLATTDPSRAKRLALPIMAELQRQLAEAERSLANPAALVQRIEHSEALDLYATGKLEEGDTSPLYTAILNRHAGPTLSLVMDRWRGERQPTTKTWAEFDRARRLFTELHTDLPVKLITPEHVRTFKATLLARTTSRGTLAPATAAKLLNALRAVLQWAKRQGYVDVNAADGVSQVSSVVTRKIVGEARRLPFTVEPARAIIATVPDDLRWSTLIALYTGARQSEILGLRREDWRREDGVTFFDIQPHAARGLKTASRLASSKRSAVSFSDFSNRS